MSTRGAPIAACPATRPMTTPITLMRASGTTATAASTSTSVVIREGPA